VRRALLAVVFVAGLAHADPKTASSAAAAAEQLVSSGKYTEACPLLEQSYHDDPQLAVLLELADCHEHVDRLATAWRELVEARELAHRQADPREDFARQRADELQTRVGYLHVDAPAPDIVGLDVRRDDIELRVGHDVAVDAGSHRLVATAPGRQTWDVTTTVVDGQTTRLAVPQLGEAVSVTTFGSRIEAVQQPDHPRKSATARTLAFGGLGLLAIGGALGGYAIYLGSEASDPKNCDGTVCNQHGTDLANQARSYARFSDVALGFAVVAETIALFVAASDQPTVQVVPVVSATGGGAVLSARF
jgi:hypothetical protein